MIPSTLREFRRQCAAAIRAAVRGDDAAAAACLREAQSCIPLRHHVDAEREALLRRCYDTGARWSPEELGMVLGCDATEAIASARLLGLA